MGGRTLVVPGCSSISCGDCATQPRPPLAIVQFLSESGVSTSDRAGAAVLVWRVLQIGTTFNHVYPMHIDMVPLARRN